MKKDMIFFAEKGLTSTSANHVANMAKEYIQTLETQLENISFYQRSVQLIGSDQPTLLSAGTNEETIAEIPSMLARVAQAKSLIAWLREAIKARVRLNSECSINLEEYCERMGITLPERPTLQPALTEDEYYGNLNIKERNRFYQLETEAAVIGKYIHPDGAYSLARQKMKDVTSNPHIVEGTGRDTLVYTYAPSVAEDTVEDLFFALQKKHREIQAELNSIKHECEIAIEKSTFDRKQSFIGELKKYTPEIEILETQRSEYVKSLQEDVARLKIVIPDSLQPIYKIISNLGK